LKQYNNGFATSRKCVSRKNNMKPSQKKDFGFNPPQADKNRGGREVSRKA